MQVLEIVLPLVSGAVCGGLCMYVQSPQRGLVFIGNKKFSFLPCMTAEIKSEDLEIESFLSRKDDARPLSQMFKLRVANYFSAATLGSNGKGSERRIVFRFLKSFNFDLRELYQAVANGAFTISPENWKLVKYVLSKDACMIGSSEEERILQFLLKWTPKPKHKTSDHLEAQRLSMVSLVAHTRLGNLTNV